MKNTIFAPIHCPRGEIGRHASLRGWCLQWCAGSNPVVGTNIDAILLLINGLAFFFPHYFPKLSKNVYFQQEKRGNHLRLDYLSDYQTNINNSYF